MKRKIAAALLAMAMLVSTTACSSGGSSSSSEAPESSAPAETSSAAEESTASEAGGESSAAGEAATDSTLTYDGEEVTITYWHTHSDQEAEVLTEQIIPEFEKQFPSIHVDAVVMPYDSVKQQMIQGVASGTGPDLMRMDIIWTTEFAELGALVAVDDLPGFAEMKDTLFEGPLSTNYYEGKYYGLPLNTNCLSGVWSKTLLEQLGLEEIPSTYDEMLDLATLGAGVLHNRSVEMAKKYVDRIKHVHLKDIRPEVVERVRQENLSFLDGVRLGAFTIPGDGCIDFVPIFKVLEDAGYEGYMLVEAEQDPAKANPLEYAIRARKFIAEKTGL